MTKEQNLTRDDIIRMAKEAGFNQILATNAGADVWIDDGFYVEEMERFAALVAAAEREACAKICDYISWSNEGKWFANEIRKRGAKASENIGIKD